MKGGLFVFMPIGESIMPQFSKTESMVIKLFAPDTEIMFEGEKYVIKECAKPRPNSGECKTDVYVKLQSDLSTRELKISVKQKNADFIENKIKYERAKEILGDNVDKILRESINSLRDKFLSQYLIVFDRYKSTYAQSIKLGWKFEFVNKAGGDLCGKLAVTPDQLKDIYAGQNLPNSKRNAFVNDQIVENSGVANYILVLDPKRNYTLKECIGLLTPVDEYVQNHPDVYFVCKALNYRATADKWDGDRPLAVYVDWSIVNGKMTGKLVFEQPLKKMGNEIGNNLKMILSTLGISTKNFRTLKDKLDNGVKYYEK